jgi:hypothetical protein
MPTEGIHIILTSGHIGYIQGIVSTIGNFVFDGHLGTHKGTDATFLAQIEQNGSLLVDESDDVDRTLPNAQSASGAFIDINPGIHIDLSFLSSSL